MKKKKLDYFSALYNVAKVINATLELPQVLSEIVRCLTETMGVKASSLRLLDPRKKKLLLAATHGLSDQYIRKGPVLVEKSGLDRKALKGKTSYKLLSEYKELSKQFWGRHIWGRGYFAASSGNVTDEIIMEYIATQDLEDKDGDFHIAP